jgi:hypothetical protein
LQCTKWGGWAMLMAPCIAQGCYQNWKWPLEVAKELNIKVSDIYKSLYNLQNIKILNQK